MSLRSESRRFWRHEVSGKQILTQWFSYRGRDRGRPIIGDRRQPSLLGEIQPKGWLAEYTTELLDVLNVLGRLILLERKQAALLEHICSSPTIAAGDIKTAAAAETQTKARRKSAKQRVERQGKLLA
jgi:hypothetical protein